ncbi:MAG: flagellin [Burkholderiales bacterium]
MASTINTNINSLNAQRNLGVSQGSLATSMQRLSSGLRINSAKDDSAGLAISERMTSQVRGMNQAVRNANDGISLAQTAEGALGEIGNNLQRIRELSVQSSNATNSTTDRAALNNEVKQLVSEIDRVSKQSDFNGTKLLDGSFSSKLFQVGANSGQAIAIDKVIDSTAGALGNVKFAAQNTGGASLDNTAVGAPDVTVSGLSINGVTIDDFKIKAGATSADSAKASATAINAKIGETGVYATVDSATSAVVLTSIKAGKDLEVVADAGGDSGLADATVLAADSSASFAKDLDINSVAGAQQAIELVDAALQSVNGSRADLGAIQNRFSSVVANLQTNSENTSASRSRIQDADFAQETANLSRSQILQQAGTAMLAQANQLPQSVLSLLR